MSIVGKQFLDDWRFDFAIQNNSSFIGTGASSVIISPSFSMKGYSRAAILCNVGPFTTKSSGEAVTVDVVVGNATIASTSMTTVTDIVSLPVGSSSVNNKAEGARIVDIYFNNSVINNTTGLAIIINDSTFTGAAVPASSHEFAVVSTLSSAWVKTLSTVLQTYKSSAVEVLPGYLSTGASTGCGIRLRARDCTSLNVRTTSTAITAIQVLPRNVSGLIEFGADELIGRNSSYTNFAVRMTQTNTSATEFTAVVLRQPTLGPESQCVEKWRKSLSTVTT